jgi:hypothetical protein
LSNSDRTMSTRNCLVVGAAVNRSARDIPNVSPLLSVKL